MVAVCRSSCHSNEYFASRTCAPTKYRVRQAFVGVWCAWSFGGLVAHVVFVVDDVLDMGDINSRLRLPVPRVVGFF